MEQAYVAYKLRIAEILNGEYHPEGDPAYLAIKDIHARAANVIGMVVGKEETLLTIDDGSGTILLRNFSRTDFFQGMNVGDTLLVIGRPREYGGERYLAADIAKQVDQRWLAVRKREIGELRVEKRESSRAPAEQMMEAIRRLDRGEGAEVEQVMRAVPVPHAELVLKNLMMSGDIFQNRPGRVKALE
ncbi:hypothetical protein HY491_03110 [Candidatus Woesearchaeota archaeon]|nr:hypothetical protein [Candidatus Woesearchaeota archaeon]